MEIVAAASYGDRVIVYPTPRCVASADGVESMLAPGVYQAGTRT